jgi:NAD(P)-dependent dehydrogenase (short-subunit alcohol dehydrogenase family)
MSENRFILGAVGDIAAFHRHPETMFEHVQGELDALDVSFAQNERHYTDADPTPVGGFTEKVSPHHADALKSGGFDVVSFASNHSMDLGEEPMIETMNRLRDQGFQVIGAGRNSAEARTPAVVEHHGTTVGFQAYCSVLRPGYQADVNKSGAAPMRAHTLYDQVDYQPGTPPKVRTWAYETDLEAALDDIARLREQVDVLVASFHWGLHFVHAEVADYEKQVAHAVIDAGADLVIGHHPHMLKGIEVYRGKPIFYSMGNFAFDLPSHELDEWVQKAPHLVEVFREQGWSYGDPEWADYTFPAVARKSMIVRCEVVGGRLVSASFVPVVVNRHAQPTIASAGSPAFDDVVDYVREVTEHQGFGTRLEVRDGVVFVDLPATAVTQ